MPAWSARERQRVVDAYLNASGRNQFVPREFLAWLRERPDHPAHPVFFAMDDADAAQAWREGRVRHWVSGLRIAVRTAEAGPSAVAGVVVRELPAMVSPAAGRSSGGGYAPVDPSDPAMVAELRRQAAGALDSWLGRYAGVTELAGVDTTPIREIAAHLAGGVAVAA
jgi:hypothetical protein